MRQRAMHVLGVLEPVWWWVRQVSGDAAYENYLRGVHDPGRDSASVAGDAGARGNRVLSAKEFYLDALRRRYTGVSRCC